MMPSWERWPRPATKALRRAAALVIVLLALGAAQTAGAQEGPRPWLAGHTFVSTDLVPDAFVHTYVVSSVGYAEAAKIDYPPVVVHGDTLQALNGSLTYALLGFEYQQALRDWIAVRIGFGMRTRLGTQMASLVKEGVTVANGYEFGWLVRLRQTPRSMLCASLAVTNQTLTIIDVRQFAEDVADGVPNASLIDYVPTVRCAAGLRWAWTPSRPFGVTVLGESSYGESPRRSQGDSWEYRLGASGDFDAGAAWGIPVGVALAYRQSSLPLITTTDDGSGSETVLRIAYNGKPDFLVAMDVLGVFSRENSQSMAVWARGAALSLRCYF